MPPRRPASRRARPVRTFFWLSLLVLLTAGGWYLVQSPARQAELRTGWASYLGPAPGAGLIDAVRDRWSGDSPATVAEVDRSASGAPSPLFAGAPRATTFTGAVRVLRNTGYVVGYCDALECPLWVAYRTWDLGRPLVAPPRPPSFSVDRRTAARVRPDEYTGSGYDRGHMAPNYAIGAHFGAAAQLETFLMSNIIPQKHSLNAGLWKELERRAATSYPARFREIWVVVGPVFGERPARLRGGVAVPEACWMVLVDEDAGGVRALAFWFPQDTPAQAQLERYLTTIDRIETAIGFDLFPELPDPAEAVLEAKTAPRAW